MDVRRAIAAIVLGLCGFACDDSESAQSSPVTGAQAGGGSGGNTAAAGTTGYSGGRGGSNTTAGSGAAASEATDYSKPEHWLCRPDNNKACATDLDATIVKADGSFETEAFTPKSDAPIDCFYVYPTVSLDATPNSDLNAGPEEESVVRAQFARFASQCRLFAPLYRQVTLTALRASIAGMPATPDRTLGIKDVTAAWRYYLEHDNNGRGVVLVGHSQGSGVLTQLLKDQLDSAPDERFIAALIIGSSVLVPKDKLVGGSFKNIPLCSKADELGCVITYASYRSNTPPAATATFGASSDPSLVAACTNPAALGGGKADLHAYLSTKGPGTSARTMGAWTTDESKTVATPFVSVPGLLSGECKFGNTGSYLAVTVNGDPSDARIDDIVGDVVTNDVVQADWGLHVIDVHLTMGNLLDVVSAKSAAYLAR